MKHFARQVLGPYSGGCDIMRDRQRHFGPQQTRLFAMLIIFLQIQPSCAQQLYALTESAVCLYITYLVFVYIISLPVFTQKPAVEGVVNKIFRIVLYIIGQLILTLFCVVFCALMVMGFALRHYYNDNARMVRQNLLPETYSKNDRMHIVVDHSHGGCNIDDRFYTYPVVCQQVGPYCDCYTLGRGSSTNILKCSSPDINKCDLSSYSISDQFKIFMDQNKRDFKLYDGFYYTLISFPLYVPVKQLVPILGCENMFGTCLCPLINYNVRPTNVHCDLSSGYCQCHFFSWPHGSETGMDDVRNISWITNIMVQMPLRMLHAVFLLLVTIWCSLNVHNRVSALLTCLACLCALILGYDIFVICATVTRVDIAYVSIILYVIIVTENVKELVNSVAEPNDVVYQPLHQRRFTFKSDLFLYLSTLVSCFNRFGRLTFLLFILRPIFQRVGGYFDNQLQQTYYDIGNFVYDFLYKIARQLAAERIAFLNGSNGSYTNTDDHDNELVNCRRCQASAAIMHCGHRFCHRHNGHKVVDRLLLDTLREVLTRVVGPLRDGVPVRGMQLGYDGGRLEITALIGMINRNFAQICPVCNCGEFRNHHTVEELRNRYVDNIGLRGEIIHLATDIRDHASNNIQQPYVLPNGENVMCVYEQRDEIFTPVFGNWVRRVLDYLRAKFNLVDFYALVEVTLPPMPNRARRPVVNRPNNDAPLQRPDLPAPVPAAPVAELGPAPAPPAIQPDMLGPAGAQENNNNNVDIPLGAPADPIFVDNQRFIYTNIDFNTRSYYYIIMILYFIRVYICRFASEYLTNVGMVNFFVDPYLQSTRLATHVRNAYLRRVNRTLQWLFELQRILTTRVQFDVVDPHIDSIPWQPLYGAELEGSLFSVQHTSAIYSMYNACAFVIIDPEVLTALNRHAGSVTNNYTVGSMLHFVLNDESSHGVARSVVLNTVIYACNQNDIDLRVASGIVRRNITIPGL